MKLLTELTLQICWQYHVLALMFQVIFILKQEFERSTGDLFVPAALGFM